eukprot:TRINITY_DN10408_c0_g1_i1.p1 TRINITY_DN10408_c0_g1~~TRINITY_DN10408_c0_g1_i1.p1  ORF type:complete len:125 (+),score=18.67 TRINITY_DN10408_c0_g1_i1:73-447(+)
MSENSEQRILYVGGLADEVTEATLESAFRPFGDIIPPVTMPKDHMTQKSRGFGFVEMETRDDAKAAIENMNGAELFGRVLKVNVARPDMMKDGGKAVWDNHTDRLHAAKRRDRPPPPGKRGREL